MAKLDENYLQSVRNSIYNTNDHQKTEFNNPASGSRKRTEIKSLNNGNSKHVHARELKHNSFPKPNKNLVKLRASKDVPTRSFQCDVVTKTEGVFPTGNSVNHSIYNTNERQGTKFNNILFGNKDRAEKSSINNKELKHAHPQELKNAFSKLTKNPAELQVKKNESIISFQGSAVIKSTCIPTEEQVSNVNSLNPKGEGKKKRFPVTAFEVISHDVIKRKKGKSTKSKINKNFDNNSILSQQKLSEKKTRNVKKLNKLPSTEGKKITDIIEPEDEINKISTNKLTLNIAKPERLKRKHSSKKKSNNINQSYPSSIEQAEDFYDDNSITVKGLKFQRFNKLFHSIQNSYMQNSNNTLTLHAKYYETLEEDDTPWNIETQCASSKPNQNKIYENRQNNETINLNDDSLLNFSEESKEESVYLEESQENEPTEKINKSLIIINLKDGCKIIVLQHLNQTVYFNGLCYMRVLNGEVNILGASLNKDSEDQKVYSPRGTSLLYIRNECKFDKNNNLALRNLVSELLLNKNYVNLSFKEHCAILLCKPLKENYIEFIESHISQKIFPEKQFSEPRIDFDLAGNWNRVLDAETWNDVLEKVLQMSRVVICGGKGVGKSTFLRYAVNRLLKKFKKLKIVDLDPGQSEFYPPGCISVVTVDKNILGPNYTHMQTADRLILSHIDIGNDVNQYLKSIKYLMESTEAAESLPTLINFPGFTQSLGLDIAANTLKLLSPTLLIEIKSNVHSRNYKVDMSSKNINNFLSSTGKFQYITKDMPILKYDYEKMNSLSEQKKAWSLEARQAREICVLSYFGKMISGGLRLANTNNIFSVNVSSLIIASFDGRVISPMAINANLVALCSLADRESKIFIAHGYGFVRGIDIDKDILVLLTPESIETLENVTHLILSSVTTPPSLIFSASSVEGHVPYVDVGDLVDFGQFTKRSYLPPLNKIIDNKKV